MPEDVRSQGELIGPNAVLQLLPLIANLGGQERVDRMLERAGIIDVPDGSEMIPEIQVARLHRQLRLEEPEMAPQLAAEAGGMTADYILAHRIPAPAQLFLKILPPKPSARALSNAIERHAWTFAGSGTFRAIDPWTYEISDNPVIRGEISESPLCHWHAAVFGRLYQALVHPMCRCEESHCCAQTGQNSCRFQISIDRKSGS